jgi:hypothetical protein
LDNDVLARNCRPRLMRVDAMWSAPTPGEQKRDDGRSCCDESGCARTEARSRGATWEAKAPDGSRITVPPESIVVDQGNPTGEPILCAYESETGWRVLCFVPGPAG